MKDFQFERILRSKTMDELRTLCRKLHVEGGYSMRKENLIERLLRHPPRELGRHLCPTWWQRRAVTVYGIATLIGATLTVVFWYYPSGQNEQAVLVDKLRRKVTELQVIHELGRLRDDYFAAINPTTSDSSRKNVDSLVQQVRDLRARYAEITGAPADDEDPILRTLDGALAYAEGRFADAIANIDDRTIENLIGATSARASIATLALRTKAFSYTQSFDWDSATVLYNAALRVDPNDWISELGLATCYMKTGAYARSREHLSSLIGRASTNAEAMERLTDIDVSGLYHNRSLAHSVLGDYTLALQDANDAVRIARRALKSTASTSGSLHLARSISFRGHLRSILCDSVGAITDLDEGVSIVTNLWRDEPTPLRELELARRLTLRGAGRCTIFRSCPAYQKTEKAIALLDVNLAVQDLRRATQLQRELFFKYENMVSCFELITTELETARAIWEATDLRCAPLGPIVEIDFAGKTPEQIWQIGRALGEMTSVEFQEEQGRRFVSGLLNAAEYYNSAGTLAIACQVRGLTSMKREQWRAEIACELGKLFVETGSVDKGNALLQDCFNSLHSLVDQRNLDSGAYLAKILAYYMDVGMQSVLASSWDVDQTHTLIPSVMSDSSRNLMQLLARYDCGDCNQSDVEKLVRIADVLRDAVRYGILPAELCEELVAYEERLTINPGSESCTDIAEFRADLETLRSRMAADE